MIFTKAKTAVFQYLSKLRTENTVLLIKINFETCLISSFIHHKLRSKLEYDVIFIGALRLISPYRASFEHMVDCYVA